MAKQNESITSNVACARSSRGVVDARGFLADEARLEEHLGAAEALAADSDDVAVWELVSLLLVGTLAGGLGINNTT